ncbi:Electrogenic sodium bicarbonate cotransporter 1 [Chelonia mydas]|uniref:Electrogenic sodium bicarbonate cotransporter 1 n=1 Tax=Chelonia mydas TaxID=8469 RepID=M7C719_CHEMY|nr:Electrogenic sodium bicarbonate cotransporter 1 [Chelonia mydas]
MTLVTNQNKGEDGNKEPLLTYSSRADMPFVGQKLEEQIECTQQACLAWEVHGWLGASRSEGASPALRRVPALHLVGDEDWQRDWKEGKKEGEEAVGQSIFTSSVSPAAGRVGVLLQKEEGKEASCPVLFIQLNELFSTPDGLQWKQTARWIKFEEKVEDGGERWSKPHITALSLHSLFELRTCIKKGMILLDLDAHSLKQIVEKVTATQIDAHALRPEVRKKLTSVLLCTPQHHTTKSQLRIVAELGAACCRDKAHNRSDPGAEISEAPRKEQLKNQFQKKIPAEAEVSNILVGEVDFLEKPFIAFIRLQEAVRLGALTEVAFPSRFLFILLGPRAKVKAYHEIGRAVATVLTDELFQRVACQAQDREDLVAGIDEFLDELTVLPPGKWDPTIRIPPPKCLPSPHKRAFGAAAVRDRELHTDSVVSRSCLPAARAFPRRRELPEPFLAAAVKGSGIGISRHLREWKSHCNGNMSAADDRCTHGHQPVSEELQRTGRLFGGLVNDIRRKAPWYWSDFYDALNVQCFSAILYIYLATVTNAITFGGMLGDATDNMQGVLESFLGTAIAGAVFCLFAGQPLTILSSTGPVLVFERLLFSFSKRPAGAAMVHGPGQQSPGSRLSGAAAVPSRSSCGLLTLAVVPGRLARAAVVHGPWQLVPLAPGPPHSRDYSLDYLEFRLWIGLWVAFFGLILVATEASYLVQYFTRFTEEGFCALISFIFIYDAVKKMLSLAGSFPVNWDYKINDVTLYGCICNSSGTGNTSMLTEMLLPAPGSTGMQQGLEAANWSLLTRTECSRVGGHLVGNSCNYIPDITFMAFILFLGTFLCSMTLKSFKTSRYFPTALRKLVSDFSIILAILIFCGIDAILGLETPKLIVPSEFKPTNSQRGWVVFPLGMNPWWVCLVSTVPAVLVIILIFMDQQITAVILNRKEYRLQETVMSAQKLAAAHMDSLRKESTTSAPGEQPKFLGIREQRLTGLVVFILTGVSVFLAPVLKYIPMPVLYGVFLYMGVAALNSIQFMDRIQLLLMPAKHQPDFMYLRHVPLRRVHLFTLIQMLCLAALWILKSTVAAIIFPVMLLALVGIRKAMECIFSRQDLSWLDDIMPEDDRKEEEEKLQRSQEKEESDSEDDVTPHTLSSGRLGSILEEEGLSFHLPTQAEDSGRRVSLLTPSSSEGPHHRVSSAELVLAGPPEQVSELSTPQEEKWGFMYYEYALRIEQMAVRTNSVDMVESFILDQEDLDNPVLKTTSELFLSSAAEGADLRTVDPETQARLEALLEAAGEMLVLCFGCQIQLYSLESVFDLYAK